MAIRPVRSLVWHKNKRRILPETPFRKDKSRTTVKEIGMTTEAKPDRGLVRIDDEECKGCGLCGEACPPKVLHLGDRLNRYGYQTAVYAGAGCTGCGICFLACPEPGAITVLRRVAQRRPISGASLCASN